MSSQPNEGFVEYYGKQLRNPPMVMMLWRLFTQDVPQVNHKTRIVFVYEGYSIQIPIMDDYANARAMDFSPQWYPAKGLKAWYLRRVKRFHKWLVDNRYHPADRPAGWHPMNIAHIGMIDISPNRMTPIYSTRTLKFERWAFKEPVPFDYVLPNVPIDWIDIIFAYDGLTDTLYLRVPREN